MADAVIDLDAIQAELGSMSEEDLRKTLLDMKVKEKVTTKKYYNPETAKKARQKMAAKKQALIALAKANGWFDQINEQANVLAAEKLAEESDGGEDSED